MRCRTRIRSALARRRTASTWARSRGSSSPRLGAPESSTIRYLLRVGVTSLEIPFRTGAMPKAAWRSPRQWPRWIAPIVIVLLFLGVLAGAGARIAYVESFQPLGLG